MVLLFPTTLNTEALDAKGAGPSYKITLYYNVHPTMTRKEILQRGKNHRNQQEVYSTKQQILSYL